MNHLTQILAGGLTAAALLGLLARPCLGQGEPPTVGFTFEKWLATPGPAPYVATFEGSAAGDVNGRLVTRVLERVQDGDTVTLKAHYVVYGSHDPSAAPLLVAEVAGQQVGTHAQLAGKVLEGWLADASVRVGFDAIECAPGKERCYRGGLSIYAGDADPPSVQWLSCQKWVTDWPRMAGIVAGDVVGTIAGEVLEATPSADGKQLHLVASYDIAVGERTFTARVEGDQDNETGRSVLIGSVTAGWHRGAWVRAEYQLTTCDGHDPCWRGTIIVAAVPPKITPSTAFQHTAAHRDRPVSFTVTASGIAPLTYQWRRDGVDLPGKTNRTLGISSARPEDDGDYTVEVRNPGGTVVSPAARLVVVPPTAEYLKRHYTNTAGVRIPYVIHVPANYDPAHRYPLACYLHGMSWGEQALPAGFEDWPNVVAVTSYRQQATDPVIMVWPTPNPFNADWSPTVLRRVLDLLDALQREYNVDPQRIYAGGYSVGASGVCDLLGQRPDFFAGAVVWAGGKGETPASKIKDVPLWAFCARDDSGGGYATRNLIAALRAAGGHPLYSEFNSGGHEGPMRVASCSPVMLDWLLGQRRGQPPTPSFAVEIGAGEPITLPAVTGASRLELTGMARAAAGNITTVSFENGANKAKGLAATTRQRDTISWMIPAVPLAADKTNAIVVTATLDTTWAPAFGGTTTFSDTVSILSTPVRLSLTLNEREVLLNWTGGVPPFSVWTANKTDATEWSVLEETVTPPITAPALGPMQFYRVTGR